MLFCFYIFWKSFKSGNTVNTEYLNRIWSPYYLTGANVPKICTLKGSFWTKYIMLELNRYRGVMLHDTQKWCKMWRKTDLWFEKWLEEIGNFLPEDSKVLKTGTFTGSFIQNRKLTSLKFTGGYVSFQWRMMQNLKMNWLVVSKLTPQFDKLWTEHSNLPKICTLMGSFWPKYMMF